MLSLSVSPCYLLCCTRELMQFGEICLKIEINLVSTFSKVPALSPNLYTNKDQYILQMADNSDTKIEVGQPGCQGIYSPQEINIMGAKHDNIAYPLVDCMWQWDPEEGLA